MDNEHYATYEYNTFSNKLVIKISLYTQYSSNKMFCYNSPLLYLV